MQNVTRPPAAYFQALGLKPDAGAREVAAAYYHLRVRLKVEAAGDAQREQVDHAFRILHSYFRKTKLASPARVKRRRAFPARTVGMATLLVLLASVLILILPKPDGISTRYEPGDVLYWKGDSSRFGVVVDYDPAHRFQVGDPVPAYQVHLGDSSDSVWISGRRAEASMRKGDAAGAPAGVS